MCECLVNIVQSSVSFLSQGTCHIFQHLQQSKRNTPSSLCMEDDEWVIGVERKAKDRHTNSQPHTHAAQTHSGHTQDRDVFTLGGGELPECDNNESEEDRCSQEDCYNDGCDGPWPQDPFFLVHGLGMCGVLIVVSEGLLRHILERVFGGDVVGWLSRHGVLVVPGCRSRVCDCLCVYKCYQEA